MAHDHLSRSFRLLKGGIVLIDPTSGAVGRIIALQYRPDPLSRTLQVQSIGGDRSDVCTIKAVLSNGLTRRQIVGHHIMRGGMR
jgi:hypothetical protein